MTGLLGSGHCLGMCGALVCGYFIRAKQVAGGAAGLFPYLAYHAARVSVYGTIGLLAAALGAALVATGCIGLAQGVLQIGAGFLVVLLGLELLGASPLKLTVGFAPARWLRRQFAGAAQKGAVRGAAIAGLVNGLMPCSMTMAMAVKATTAPSVPEGGLLLLAFGAGTLPSMLLASVLFGRLGPRVRGLLQKGAGVFVIALGLSTLWQGLAYFRVMQKLVF
ncbi:MAG: sulfite exporter TauE/SafE family protein [Rhodocyclaceae bacterium]|nr:sulfite exporter TauE/SafE family protein [Rhodocyclaceae bacterium]